MQYQKKKVKEKRKKYGKKGEAVDARRKNTEISNKILIRKMMGVVNLDERFSNSWLVVKKYGRSEKEEFLFESVYIKKC